MEVPMVVNDFLFRAESLYGPKEAVVDGDKRFTYAEFARRCYKLAHGLTSLGVGKGDRVGILSPNSHHFLESFYGTSLIGAVLVPLNYRLVSEDFQYAFSHSGAKASSPTPTSPPPSTPSVTAFPMSSTGSSLATATPPPPTAGGTGRSSWPASPRRPRPTPSSTRTTSSASTTPLAPPPAPRA